MFFERRLNVIARVERQRVALRRSERERPFHRLANPERARCCRCRETFERKKYERNEPYKKRYHGNLPINLYYI